jgi:cysteine desulfuration protein SufE
MVVGDTDFQDVFRFSNNQLTFINIQLSNYFPNLILKAKPFYRVWGCLVFLKLDLSYFCGELIGMSIKEIQEEIVDEFSMFDDWMQRYEYIIELGKSLPLIDEQYKTDDHIIKGCQSKVWVHAQMPDNRLDFTADSDAIITKGIIAILVRVFGGQHPKDIMEADTEFLDEIGLKDHLSPTRANGLVSMVKQLKLYAVAYQTQLNS